MSEPYGSLPGDVRKVFAFLVILAFFPAQEGCSPVPTEVTNFSDQRLQVQINRSLLEEAAIFNNAMPAGVAVSSHGRIFVSFPRWGDPVDYTLVEVRNGRERPFPSSDISAYSKEHPKDTLVSVQSVVVDTQDRLWALDTGSVKFGAPVPGGAKLVGFDLKTRAIFKKILFDPDVVLPTTYLNDVRVDLSKGAEGTAYVSDSSDHGPNAIIVVDLATGRAQRRLNDHPSTKAEAGFVAFIEGRPFMRKTGTAPPKPLTTGCDGIALDPRGERLYYCALAGRTLYSVPTVALLDDQLTPEERAEAVHNEGMKPASDGMVFDNRGFLYMTAYEYRAIVRRNPAGVYETVVSVPSLLWPDTLAISAHGWLYMTVNQLHRQADFQDGKDLRTLPYFLYRMPLEEASQRAPKTLDKSAQDVQPVTEPKP